MVDLSTCLTDEKPFPPGFRFHPTDEELVLYYLKRKICRRRHRLDVIGETDVYKWDPEELPGMSKLKTGDKQWFFFSPRDRKYPNGGRCSRGARHGYWKATGKDRKITCGQRNVGIKKTLVFYKGKAPKGDRTDWVMHEYTLDEEELKRCQNAQDYYVLYKVYKKSGPGPKNGEQYGAEFKEEDWADDAVEYQHLPEPNQLKLDEGIRVNDNNNPNDNIERSLNPGQDRVFDELEEIMNQIVGDSLPAPLDVDYSYALDQFVGEKETQSAIVENPSGDVYLPVMQQGGQQPNALAGLDLAWSGETQLQSCEASEITSASNTKGKALMTEEDFLEDFLEMNDLFGPEPTNNTSCEYVDNLENLQFDGFGDLGLSEDISLLLDEVGPGEFGHLPGPFVNNFEGGVTDPVSSAYNDIANYQPQPQFNDLNGISSQLWSNEQRLHDPVTADANQSAIPSSISGQNQSPDFTHPTGANNESDKKDDGTDSWLSSALWSFVESIPTTPASASESTLVNNAFGRISSFSRVRRASARNAGNTCSTPRCSGKGGFLCLSLLGIFCAMMWVLIGTSLKLRGYLC